MMYYSVMTQENSDKDFFFAYSKFQIEGRTVPTFVTAHTVCASRDTLVSYGWCQLIQGYFCAV